MKDRALIHLKIPFADRCCDICVPLDVPLRVIIPALEELLRVQYPQDLQLRADPHLWSARDGMPLDADATLREQGIMDSNLLYLI